MKRAAPFYCLLLIGSFWLAWGNPLLAQTTADDDSWQRYSFILRTSTLEWSLSDPFQLKVDFQLYSLDGNPTEKGTAEELWSQDGVKIRINSPSLIEGDPSVEEDHYKTHTRESYLVTQALRAITRPFASTTKRPDFAMGEFHQTVGASELSCFSLIQPGKSRTSTSSGYCTDADNHIVAMVGQLFVLERSDFRQYHGHQIPNAVRLSYEGKPALEVRVTEVNPIPAPVGSVSSKKTAMSPTHVPSDVMTGHLLNKPDPSYPKEAKKKHLSGSVLISAIITKQGTITATDVIASPSPLLSQAAEDAIKAWTYSPYLFNGIPLEVDTSITVNFSFGR